jgi:hypothetical protein
MSMEHASRTVIDREAVAGIPSRESTGVCEEPIEGLAHTT